MPYDLSQVISRLSDWCESKNFAGYDPYDALNSPLAPILSLGWRWGRIALTQFGRRSPVNYRPLLLIRPGVNPKALGLFLESYTRLANRQGNDRYENLVHGIVDRLLDLRSSGVSGSAWGYHFPWQNRMQLLPRWTPTIVNSAFIGHALLDAFETFGVESARTAALTIPDFFLSDLNRKSAGDSFCFSYTPRDKNFVHNANMLGASLLARIAVNYGRSDLLAPALSALKYSMDCQREDGSWFYAETKQQSWIDSFHTGFNLESLRRFLRLGLVPEYKQAYEKGREFYAKRFLMPDGTPKYYHDRLYLTDIHAPAEMLFFFAQEPGYRDLTNRVLDWTLKNMYDARTGLFYFRKLEHFTIKTPYMRWSEAWAFRALSALL